MKTDNIKTIEIKGKPDKIIIKDRNLLYNSSLCPAVGANKDSDMDLSISDRNLKIPIRINGVTDYLDTELISERGRRYYTRFDKLSIEKGIKAQRITIPDIISKNWICLSPKLCPDPLAICEDCLMFSNNYNTWRDSLE